jgi:hypothetical protein
MTFVVRAADTATPYVTWSHELGGRAGRRGRETTDQMPDLSMAESFH